MGKRPTRLKIHTLWRSAYIAECPKIDEPGNIYESGKIFSGENLVSVNPEIGSTLAQRRNQKCFSPLLQFFFPAAVFSVVTQRFFPQTAVCGGGSLRDDTGNDCDYATVEPNTNSVRHGRTGPITVIPRGLI